jgi:glucokinase
MKHIIGIDVGGTNVVAGLFSPEGTLLRSIKRPTLTDKGSDGLLGQLAELSFELLNQTGLAPFEHLGAIGLGLPGFIDADTGLVNAANLPLAHIPVGVRLRELAGVPVTVQNDVKMIVYGESLRGAGQDHQHILGVTLGTGLASAWVTRGQLHDGAGNLAGELGHITFPDIPYVCGCGMKGCLETVASATGLIRQAKDGLAGGWAGPLAVKFPESRREGLTARDIWSAAVHDGDAFAVEVFRRTAEWLAQALVPPIAILSPDVILVGGGVAAAGDLLFTPLIQAISERLHPLYRKRLRIVAPKLGDDAGIYGSAEYAKRTLFE